MKDKICIVTGANSGIGKETARELASKGATVVLACRNPDKGAAALQEIEESTGSHDAHLILLDLGSIKSIRQFAGAIADTFPRIDVLVNNAGAYIPYRRETEDGFEMTMGVNHFGTFLLTQLLLDPLREASSARIINVSSLGHKMAKLDLDDLHSERSYKAMRVYYNSKLANIYHMHGLNKRLEGTKITVNCLHPGVIGSGFAQQEKSPFGFLVKLGKPFLSSTRKGARTSVYLASSPEVEGVCGAYFVRCTPAKTSKAAQDLEIAERLWSITEEAVGVSS
jgi:NAD(P)-dependent dehydrogenase (short-subunit alcohol dehydrogenase family)